MLYERFQVGIYIDASDSISGNDENGEATT